MNQATRFQQHRDAWRKYAYGKGPRPTDYLASRPSPERTRIEELQAVVERLEGVIASLEARLQDYYQISNECGGPHKVRD